MSATIILGGLLSIVVIFILAIFIMRSMEDTDEIFPDADDDNESYEEYKKTRLFGGLFGNASYLEKLQDEGVITIHQVKDTVCNGDSGSGSASVTLSACKTAFPNNCFSNNTTSNAVAFCDCSSPTPITLSACRTAHPCDSTPFGAVTAFQSGGSAAALTSAPYTSNLLDMYNLTSLDITDATDDIFGVSNIITLGACYVANQIKEQSEASNDCQTLQTSLADKGVFMSNAQMNVYFSCTLDSATRALGGTAVFGDLESSTLTDACTNLGYDGLAGAAGATQSYMPRPGPALIETYMMSDDVMKDARRQANRILKYAKS